LRRWLRRTANGYAVLLAMGLALFARDGLGSIRFLLFGFQPEFPLAVVEDAVPVATEGNGIITALFDFQKEMGRLPYSLAELRYDEETQHRWFYEVDSANNRFLDLRGSIDGRSGMVELYAGDEWMLHLCPTGRDNQQYIPLGVPVPAPVRSR